MADIRMFVDEGLGHSSYAVDLLCGHGKRAMTAASILTNRGHRDVTVLDGGPDTWATATGRGLEVSR